MHDKDPKGYYAVLGVPPNASDAEVKSAFRRKAMAIHPDRNNSADATEQFKLLNKAYEVIGDPAERARYDMSLGEAGEPNENSSSAERRINPISCSNCGKVSAQPRYVIFFQTMSFILMTRRSGVHGVFL